MTEGRSNSSAKLIFGLIVGIPVLVIGASSLLYFLADRGVVDMGTVNRGQLIDPPVQIAEIDPVRAGGEPLLFNQPDSQWNFLVVGDRDCAGACERMLYLTRQTHIALGKKMNRVGRIYLNVDGGGNRAFSALMEAEHGDMVSAHADAQDWKALLAQRDLRPLAPNQFFVVDPKGWVMMVYTAESLDEEAINALGKDVLKDMKRLLR